MSHSCIFLNDATDTGSDAPALERLSIYEAVLFQVHALCVQSAPNPPSFEDASVRARLFWYAYTEEGMLTGLRGSRLVLYAFFLYNSIDLADRNLQN